MASVNIIHFFDIFVVKKLFGVKWKTRSAECGVRSAECGVRSAECGVWKMRSVENAECGKRGV